MRTDRRWALAALVVVALALGACSSGDSDTGGTAGGEQVPASGEDAGSSVSSGYDLDVSSVGTWPEPLPTCADLPMAADLAEIPGLPALQFGHEEYDDNGQRVVCTWNLVGHESGPDVILSVLTGDSAARDLTSLSFSNWSDLVEDDFVDETWRGDADRWAHEWVSGVDFKAATIVEDDLWISAWSDEGIVADPAVMFDVVEVLQRWVVSGQPTDADSQGEDPGGASEAQALAEELAALLRSGADASALDAVSPGFSSLADELLGSGTDLSGTEVIECDADCFVIAGGAAWTWTFTTDDGRAVVASVRFDGGGL